MNHPELLDYGKADQNENKYSINIHCSKCGKYKDKKSLSTLCTVCLFHMTTEDAIKRGYIQA
jgi:hypothetical protein